MAKVRVYELAKHMGVDSEIAMAKLKELGVFVRSASSTLEEPVACKLIDAVLGSETETALERLRARFWLESGSSQKESEDDGEREITNDEITDEEFLAWERSRLAAAAEREQQALAEIIAKEIAEQDRRYKAAMGEPFSSVRRMEETSEIATVPEEIGQLRIEIELATRAVMTAMSSEVTALRKEITQIRNELAPRSATTSLASEMSQLQDQVAQLRRDTEQNVAKRDKTSTSLASEMSQLQDQVAQLRRDTVAKRDKTSAIEETVRRKTKALEDEIAKLRKQVGALKREVSELSRETESFYEEPKQPSRPTPTYQSPATKPYPYASAIEESMGETPRAIYEQQKAREHDPFRYRD